MLGFLPALARRLLGEDLILPNVATWWLRRPRPRGRSRPARRVDDCARLRPAPRRQSAGRWHDRRPGLDAEERARPARRSDQAFELVGQEGVDLDNARLGRRPAGAAAVHAAASCGARRRDGWQVMQGGFCRIAENDDPRRSTSSEAAAPADVWVLSDKPVEQRLAAAEPDRDRDQTPHRRVPSRAADNLFWLGRYLERTEATLRLVRALGTAPPRATRPVRRAMRDFGRCSAPGRRAGGRGDVRRRWSRPRSLQQRELGGALPFLVAAAQSAASVIRERLSPDACRALDELVAMIRAPSSSGQRKRDLRARQRALRIIAAFSGLAQENMSQLVGWRFLRSGGGSSARSPTCAFIAPSRSPTRPRRRPRLLLELTDSQITYRLRYVMVAAPAPVIDLVVLDTAIRVPSAIQIGRIETHLAVLPKLARRRDDAARAGPIALATKVRTADAAEIDEAMLAAMQAALMRLSDVVTAAISPGRTLRGVVGSRSDDLRRPSHHDLSLRVAGRLCALMSCISRRATARASASMPRRSPSIADAGRAPRRRRISSATASP